MFGVTLSSDMQVDLWQEEKEEMKLVFFLCLMGEKVFVAEIFLGVSTY